MNIQVDNHAYPLQTYTPAAQSPAADSWDDFDATMVPASLNVRGSSQSTRLRFTASDESTLRDSFDQGEHVQQRQQQQQQQPQLLHRPSEAFLVDNASTHPAMIQRSTSPPRQHPIALQPPARHPGRPVTRGPVIAELEATTPASSLPPPHLDLWKTSYAPTPMISRQPRSEPAHDNDTQVRQSTYLADLNRRTGMVLGPTQQELLFPRLSQLEDESRQLARQSEQSSASKRGKCDFSILTVLLVALCALLVGGGLGGGIAAAVMGAHGKASAATSASPAPASATLATMAPSNVTNAQTCLCCASAVSNRLSTSQASTYISALLPTSAFRLHCSSGLSLPPASVGQQQMAGGALDTGLVTTSFANCMDLCAAWNADADKVKKSGKCGGVTWMVQGKQGENNLVCELKKAGVVWNAWSEGRRGVSALLDA